MGGAIRRVAVTSYGETNGYIKGDPGIIGSPPGNMDSYSAADAAQFLVIFAQLLVPDKHPPMIDKAVKGKNLIQRLPPLFIRQFDLEGKRDHVFRRQRKTVIPCGFRQGISTDRAHPSNGEQVGR